MPKLDLRCVRALRQIDANGIVLALAFIVFAKSVTQTRGLDAHEGIGHGVERLGTIEDCQSEVVALQPATTPSQRFIDDVFEKPLPAARLSERAALQYAVHLFANGLLVGFAPAIERNDRHALTPNAMKKAGPGCIGVGCIQYYTTIKRQSLSLWAPEIAA